LGISPPQTLTRITHSQYLKIKTASGILERYTVN
jgi:hypothetical protein